MRNFLFVVRALGPEPVNLAQRSFSTLMHPIKVLTGHVTVFHVSLSPDTVEEDGKTKVTKSAVEKADELWIGLTKEDGVITVQLFPLD